MPMDALARDIVLPSKSSLPTLVLVGGPGPEVDVWDLGHGWEALHLSVFLGGLFNVELEFQQGMWPPWNRPFCCEGSVVLARVLRMMA